MNPRTSSFGFQSAWKQANNIKPTTAPHQSLSLPLGPSLSFLQGPHQNDILVGSIHYVSHQRHCHFNSLSPLVYSFPFIIQRSSYLSLCISIKSWFTLSYLKPLSTFIAFRDGAGLHLICCLPLPFSENTTAWTWPLTGSQLGLPGLHILFLPHLSFPSL